MTALSSARYKLFESARTAKVSQDLTALVFQLGLRRVRVPDPCNSGMGWTSPEWFGKGDFAQNSSPSTRKARFNFMPR